MKEGYIKSMYLKLEEILSGYKRLEKDSPEILMPLMSPFFNRIDEVIKPGFTMLTWTSLNVDSCEYSNFV